MSKVIIYVDTVEESIVELNKLELMNVETTVIVNDPSNRKNEKTKIVNTLDGKEIGKSTYNVESIESKLDKSIFTKATFNLENYVTKEKFEELNSRLNQVADNLNKFGNINKEITKGIRNGIVSAIDRTIQQLTLEEVENDEENNRQV